MTKNVENSDTHARLFLSAQAEAVTSYSSASSRDSAVDVTCSSSARLSQSLNESTSLSGGGGGGAGGGGGGALNGALSRSRANIIELNDNQQRAPKDERVSVCCSCVDVVTSFIALCLRKRLFLRAHVGYIYMTVHVCTCS